MAWVHLSNQFHRPKQFKWLGNSITYPKEIFYDLMAWWRHDDKKYTFLKSSKVAKIDQKRYL